MTVHPAVLGRFFDDFEVGDVYQHPFGRTITEADNAWFTLLTCNTNQMHFNSHLSAAEPDHRGPDHRGVGVHGRAGARPDRPRHEPERGGQPRLEQHQADAPGLRGRHHLRREHRAPTSAPSKSRPDMGIISMITRALNQDGDVVMTYDRSVMIPTRASGIGQNYFPQAKAGPLEVPAPTQ